MFTWKCLIHTNIRAHTQRNSDINWFCALFFGNLFVYTWEIVEVHVRNSFNSRCNILAVRSWQHLSMLLAMCHKWPWRNMLENLAPHTLTPSHSCTGLVAACSLAQAHSHIRARSLSETSSFAHDSPAVLCCAVCECFVCHSFCRQAEAFAALQPAAVSFHRLFSSVQFLVVVQCVRYAKRQKAKQLNKRREQTLKKNIE